MSSAAERDHRKLELAIAYRVFGGHRWGDTADGHITARDPELTDHFWLARGGVPFKDVDPDDLVLVGPDGSTADGTSINVTAYHIHHPIHAARPDVVGAAHTHTPWGTPFSAEARLLEPITQESTIFFEDHALFDDEEVQVQSVDAGKRIAAALGATKAVILRNHGLLTVGASVGEAMAWFMTMERSAEAHLKARNPEQISAEAARFNQADLTKPGMADGIFQSLARWHAPELAAELG